MNLGYYEIDGTDRFKKQYEQQNSLYKEYRTNWNRFPKEYFLSEFPLHIDLEATNKCNLKCEYCYRNTINDETGFMGFDLYKKVLDEATTFNLPSIKLNRRGEPLLHNNISKMVKYAKEKGVVDVQFNTNGMLLNEIMSVQLIDSKLDRLIVSLDGATQRTHESIRKGANYSVTVENIKRFIRIRNEQKKEKPFVRVQMTVSKNNEHEVSQLIHNWKDIVNKISFNVRRKPTLFNSDKDNDISHVPCNQIWQRISVLWDGDVVMCCGDWTKKYLLGNAYHKTIYELWHSNKYNHIRDMHKKEQYNNISICKYCEYNRKRKDMQLEQFLNNI